MSSSTFSGELSNVGGRRVCKKMLKERVGYTLRAFNEAEDTVNRGAYYRTSLMHAALWAYERLCYLNLRFDLFDLETMNSVLHEMMQEAMVTPGKSQELTLLKCIVLIIKKKQFNDPYNSTAYPWTLNASDWAKIESMRLAVAMSQHPRLGAGSLMNALEPGVLHLVASQCYNFFDWSARKDRSIIAARWVFLYRMEGGL
jgi:hypothetical protein